MGISKPGRMTVIERDGFACLYCGAVLLGDLGVPNSGRITCDHIIPRNAGGHHQPSNLVVSCLYCNVRKGGDVGHAASWLAFPPRTFDASVMLIVDACAARLGWGPDRLTLTRRLVSGEQRLHDENVWFLRQYAARDGSEFAEPVHGFKPTVEHQSTAPPIVEVPRTVSKLDRKKARNAARRTGDTGEHIAEVVSRVVTGEQWQASQERSARLTRFSNQHAKPRNGRTWGDEHLIADPTDAVVVEPMTWGNSTRQVRDGAGHEDRVDG